MRWLHCALVLMVFGASCAAPSGLYTEEGLPIVGKVATRDETIDLTRDAFGHAPGKLSPEWAAQIHADIDLDPKTPHAGLAIDRAAAPHPSR